MEPVVSVIVPTLNESALIGKCLASLQRQTFPREKFEIIVSDSSSDDGTAEIAGGLADKVVACERRSAAFGRNWGARHARGKYLVFVDGDTVVSETFIEGAAEALEKGVAATGPISPLEKDSAFIGMFIRYWSFQSFFTISINAPIFPGFNFAVRAEEFRKLGGFQEQRTGEDIDLSLRLARTGKIIYNRKMSVSTSTRRMKEQGVVKYALNGFTYFFFRKSVPWDKYRKDFSGTVKNPKVLFVISADKDSGIYTSGWELVHKMRSKGMNVDVDRFFGSGYDVVHLHTPLPTSFFISKFRFGRTHFVCTTNMTEEELDGLVPNFLIGLSKKYLKYYYSNFSKIICSSEQIKSELDSAGFGKKTVFIPLGIDREFFRQDRSLGRKFREKYGLKRKIVINVASIQKRKGIFDFAEMARRLPQYDFVWVGKMPMVGTLQYRDKIEKIVAGKRSNLFFPGYLQQEDLVNAYNAADVFLSPTYSETFGLTIIEAASCGIPVIIRDLKDLKNFDSFAEKFTTNDGLMGKITGLLENGKAYEKASKLGLVESARFSVDAQADSIIGIYRELTGK